jgi:peptidyl-prolyl cis-trans isomerase SurA
VQGKEERSHMPVGIIIRNEMRKACNYILTVILAIVLIALLLGPGVVAQKPEGEIIDRVIAVVEGRSILQSELELEYKRYILQEGRTSLTDEERKEIKKKIFDIMVNDLLMVVHAENKGVQVDEGKLDDEVQEAVENSMREMGGKEEFERRLEEEGLTLASLRRMWREKLRARKLVEKLWATEVMGEIRVDEGEVRKYYSDHLDELPIRPASVKIAQILLEPEATEVQEKKALEKIKRYKSMLADGEDFASLAQEYSEGPSAKYGGSLGYIQLEDLNNPAFADAVRKLKVGEISEPVLTKFGYHLIKLEDISDERVLVRHILVKAEKDREAEQKTRELAEKIREDLIHGADFGEMASRHSDDVATRKKGGVVGEIALKRLPQYFREKIEDLDVGEISEIIEDDKGFRIIKVLDRSEERKYRYDEAKEELRNLLRQQKLQGRVEGYVEGLKEEYAVNVKEDALE